MTKTQEMFDWIFGIKFDEVQDYLKNVCNVNVDKSIMDIIKEEIKPAQMAGIDDFIKDQQLFADADCETSDEEYLKDEYEETMGNAIFSALESHGIKTTY